MVKYYKAQGERVPKTLLPPYINGLALEMINFYFKVATQWNYIVMPEKVVKSGLRYESVFAVANSVNLNLVGDKFTLLQHIENKIIELEREQDVG